MAMKIVVGMNAGVVCSSHTGGTIGLDFPGAKYMQFLDGHIEIGGRTTVLIEMYI